MTERLAKRLTQQLFQNGLIKEDDREIYQYAVLVLIERIIGFSIIFLLAYIWNVFGQTVLFLLFFSSLRKYTGGYHAKNFQGCLIGTGVIYMMYVKVICPVMTLHMNENRIALLIAGSMIFILGAVNHPNMDWSKEEYQNSKKMARITVILEIGLIMAFTCLGMEEQYILFMSFGVMLCAILLLLGKLMGQEIKEYERECEVGNE